MENLDDYIKRYLPKDPDDIFAVGPLPEYPDIDPEQIYGPQWTPREDSQQRPSFPRVLPTPPTAREAMAHDGGPGVKDHSIIKRLLRDMK